MFSDRRIRTSLLAIATDLFLTIFKVILAAATGSAALRADAFHSATDLIVSIVLLGGIFYRRRQEEKNSASGTSAGVIVESCLAIFVALIILYVPFEIVLGLGQAQAEDIDNIPLGIIGTGIIIFIVLFISKFKLFVGRETDSIALEADGYHSMVDVFTSVAVLISLVGALVGIYMDKIIAVIIAIMIAVTGIELFASGVRSLLKKTEFDQLSLIEYLLDGIKRRFRVGSSMRVGTPLFHCLKKNKRGLLGLTLLAYALSGLFVVDDRSLAKQSHFGVIANSELSPGLHFGLPWPFGSVEVFDLGVLYSVEFGTHSNNDASPNYRMWRDVNQNSAKFEKVNYHLTADEQLIDLTSSVAYTVDNPIAIARQISDHRRFVQETAEYSLNKYILSKNIDDLLLGDRGLLEREFQNLLQADLDLALNGIQVAHAQFQTFRLPASVISAYRDLINAAQEKEQSINNAIADQLQALPLARAAYHSRVASSSADSKAVVLEAEGDIARIAKLAEVQVNLKSGFEFDAYIKTVEEVLSNKEIVIKDQGLSNLDIKAWKE